LNFGHTTIMETETQETSTVPELGFAQRGLPWLVAVGALVLYSLTINHWLRLESLDSVARATGWDWTPQRDGPLFFLVTLPFRALPGAIQPLALNCLSAVLAALTLGLLARSVALLPFDRTREARQREHHELALLSIPLAWVAPLAAVVLCGVSYGFWMNATAGVRDMLDLFLFAWVVRCLLEYRLDRREEWLLKLAFVYGLGVATNYAMIAFFPACLVAVVWTMQEAAFEAGVWLRMLGCGVAGLLGYLILPAAGVITGNAPYGFWHHLRLEFALQKGALLAVPRWLVFMLVLQSVVPVLLMGIRWRAAQGDTNPAGARLAVFIMRFMHILMWAVCLSVFLDFQWGPRRLGAGTSWLPLYYLAALGAGYYTGYLLLVFQTQVAQPWEHKAPATRLAGRAVAGLVLLLTCAACAWLVVQNLPAVRKNDGQELAQLADMIAHSLPATPAYLMSDGPTELMLAEAALFRQAGQQPHVLVNTRLLPYPPYHAQLARQYPGRWSPLPAAAEGVGSLDAVFLASLVARLAASNAVFYLHPSLGYYFEVLQAVPHGAVVQLVSMPTNSLGGVAVPSAELDAIQKFWTGERTVLAAIMQRNWITSADALYVHLFLSRALNCSGVTLQRHGRLAEAGPWFEAAEKLFPENIAARENRIFNGQLREHKLPALDLTKPLVGKPEADWSALLLQCGPFDSPAWTFAVGRAFAEGQLFRQAVGEFQRVQKLCPANATVQVWTGSTEALVRLALGDAKGAEQQALALRGSYPKDAVALETLTQIYMTTDRWPEVERSTQEELEVNPANVRALLNLAAARVKLKNFAGAIPPLDQLLKVAPRTPAALFNRAIACLQSGRLSEAELDYRELLEIAPETPAIRYGLGEIADQRKDTNNALLQYRRYLSLAQPGTAEYKEVEQRVKALAGGVR
jgi:tetratricopeptide (TPR) repeat protein